MESIAWIEKKIERNSQLAQLLVDLLHPKEVEEERKEAEKQLPYFYPDKFNVGSLLTAIEMAQ